MQAESESQLPDAMRSVFLVDDHQMFLDGIKMILKKDSQLHIIGEANDGGTAMALITQNPPQLVITDVSMPGMSGIELTRKLKAEFPDIKVLVLTMYDDYEIIQEIMGTDADGYILKNTGRTELLRAVNRILDNGTFYSAAVMEKMMKGHQRQKRLQEETGELTEREQEILTLISNELSTHEIADKLCISPRTVDTHRKHLLEKTGAKNVVGLIRFAYEHGMMGNGHIK
jgi:DNA-binding NarL/FixJ family response regulator